MAEIDGGQPRLTLINPPCAVWSDKYLFIKNNGTTYRVVSATDALRGARRTTSRADHRERCATGPDEEQTSMVGKMIPGSLLRQDNCEEVHYIRDHR